MSVTRTGLQSFFPRVRRDPSPSSPFRRTSSTPTSPRNFLPFSIHLPLRLPCFRTLRLPGFPSVLCSFRTSKTALFFSPPLIPPSLLWSFGDFYGVTPNNENFFFVGVSFCYFVGTKEIIPHSSSPRFFVVPKASVRLDPILKWERLKSDTLRPVH